ncbi:MGMT family protein [Gallalistipes aquisgranensis]|uniref:MGMT family protein n=1 Tax=Gallalistipes aquisgranensis TaxID=2779358 RepID=UPI001CF8314E|nr:MGMT family protein [Gallalistipes aquisgranensis]MBE5034647.1 MGMT family protein [Gallalistipes aquisgranensis]
MTQQERDEFTAAVFDAVRAVPRGRITSYGAIARAVGRPNLSRMVGRILAGCECSRRGIPAHRVLGNGGRLSGKAAFGAPDRLQRLLEEEGLEIRNDRVRRWKEAFWDPAEELLPE